MPAHSRDPPPHGPMGPRMAQMPGAAGKLFGCFDANTEEKRDLRRCVFCPHKWLNGFGPKAPTDPRGREYCHFAGGGQSVIFSRKNQQGTPPPPTNDKWGESRKKNLGHLLPPPPPWESRGVIKITV